MFDRFDPEDKCPDCGKRLIDLENRTEVCQPCELEGMIAIAHMGPLEHFWLFITCFFGFYFSDAFVELRWTFESLLGIGDYGKDGFFSQFLDSDNE